MSVPTIAASGLRQVARRPGAGSSASILECARSRGELARVCRHCAGVVAFCGTFLCLDRIAWPLLSWPVPKWTRSCRWPSP